MNEYKGGSKGGSKGSEGEGGSNGGSRNGGSSNMGGRTSNAHGAPASPMPSTMRWGWQCRGRLRVVVRHRVFKMFMNTVLLLNALALIAASWRQLAGGGRGDGETNATAATDSSSGSSGSSSTTTTSTTTAAARHLAANDLSPSPIAALTKVVPPGATTLLYTTPRPGFLPWEAELQVRGHSI